MGGMKTRAGGLLLLDLGKINGSLQLGVKGATGRQNCNLLHLLEKRFHIHMYLCRTITNP